MLRIWHLQTLKTINISIRCQPQLLKRLAGKCYFFNNAISITWFISFTKWNFNPLI